MLNLDENFMYWIAGLFEGEASFIAPSPSAPYTARICLHMTDEDIIVRVADAFQSRYNYIKPGKENWSPSYSVNIQGKNAVKVMKCLFPIMSKRRQEKIKRAIIPRWNYVKPEFILEPPKPRSLNELLWLAGLLEGEGSFLKPPPSDANAPRVQMWSTDEDVIQKVADLWQLKYTTYERGGVAKTAYFIMMRGKRAMEQMRLLYPLMGIRRKHQIEAALSGYDPALYRKAQNARSPFTPDEVKAIKQKLKSGQKIQAIAQEYGVRYQAVYRIATGQRWAWLE